MNRLKSSVLTVLAVMSMFVSLGLMAEPVAAQGSAALSIPPRKNYTIEPGKGVNDKLQVRNLDQQEDLVLSLRVVDFTYTDDGGTPKLMLDENAPQTAWSLKPFIKIQDSVIIPPSSSESIDVSIDIPENQGAGSYYSAIVFSSGASQGGNVGLSASGVSLAFVSVPGEVNEKLTLKKLGTYDPLIQNSDGSKGRFSFFNLNMPQSMGYTLKNDGNVAEAPAGSITLRNLLFGREIVINDINPSKSLALIGQTRTFNTCIRMLKEAVDFNGSREEASKCSEEPGLWPGLYRIQMDGFYGWNGNATQEIMGKAWMLYTPWWFLVILLALIAFVTYHGLRIWQFIQVKRGRAPASKKRVTLGRK